MPQKIALFTLGLFLAVSPAAHAEGNNTPSLIVAPGLIEPAGEERVVGSEIIGVLKEINVEENDVVKAGQVIATISNDDQVARLAEAKANEAEAQANLIVANQDLSRQRQLAQNRTAAQSELERSQAKADAAHAILQRTKAQRALAEANLAKTILKAPINGTVLRRYILAGEAVTNQPPTRIISLGNLDLLRVRAQVDELDIGRLTIGQPVIIKADAFPNLEAVGRVSKITLRMDERSVQTSRTRDRVDTNVLPVLIDVESSVKLPVGLRVDAYFKPVAQAETPANKAP
jgi:HlyD family secretion protein